MSVRVSSGAPKTGRGPGAGAVGGGFQVFSKCFEWTANGLRNPSKRTELSLNFPKFWLRPIFFGLQHNYVNVQSISKGFEVRWQSIRSIWKELEGSTDSTRARTTGRLRRAGTDSDRHVRARRVRIDLTDCKGA